MNTHTHTVNTHPEQWAAIYAAAPGEQLGVRCHAQGHLSRGIEGGENAGYSLPPPTIPWSHIAIDFVTDLPNSRNYTTILTVIDRFSKACRLIPLPKLPTAFETAEALLEQVFRFYGLPEDIVSDRGPQFTSRVWKAFCQQLNINVSLTSGYHPQSNGQVERLNQEITRFLRSYCHQNQNDWSRFLLWAEYAQNSLASHQPASPLFSVSSASSLLCFPGQESHQNCPQSMTG